MTTMLKPMRMKHAKRAGKSAAKKAGCGAKHAGDKRRDSKTVAAFNRWLLANAQEVGKWARENTKRLAKGFGSSAHLGGES